MQWKIVKISLWSLSISPITIQIASNICASRNTNKLPSYLSKLSSTRARSISFWSFPMCTLDCMLNVPVHRGLRKIQLTFICRLPAWSILNNIVSLTLICKFIFLVMIKPVMSVIFSLSLWMNWFRANVHQVDLETYKGSAKSKY